eukprot:2401783-Amphidinium_carterae.1
MGFNRLKNDVCIFGNVKTNDLLVVGNPLTVKPFSEQFKVKLELKHISQLTIDTPLVCLGKSIELQLFNKMAQFTCHSHHNTTGRS